MLGKAISIEHPSFSRDWWSAFLAETADRTQSLVVRNALSEADVRQLREEAGCIVRNSALADTFRTYINGKQADNRLVASAPPAEGEDMDVWRTRVFGADKFSLIINQCEQLSGVVASFLEKAVVRLQEITGLPLLGYNSTVFMGNYGFTPLGIHHDGTGNNVLHFHIGPGDKVMYNWDEDQYTADMASRAFDEQLAAADEYRFSAGDLYYMPWNKYHIGNTEAFSIGITLWFNNPTRASYLRKLSDDFLVRLVGDGEAVIHAGQENGDRTKLFELASVLRDNAQDRSFRSLLYDEHQRTMRRLASGGYWFSKSRPEDDRVLTKEDLDREIYVAEPYRLLYFRRGRDLYLYGRGHEQVLDYSDGLTAAIDKINNETTVYRMGDFIQDLSAPLSQRQAFVLLSDWYRKKIIALR
ncbi:hypothetical protein [Dinghuibacter silviterrae]|uniref:JmjC domain-containing protein n=1 Tax=Dinghuibacter silviterrae TaxID=1539049 RepID=A0A4R8DHF3_9BACT|nr:hypothetical protein [Dinghuibacter silviterrae]TDW96965.1 hypothetical protein EDB95_4801 [Dinghuibacter silviterrae]